MKGTLHSSNENIPYVVNDSPRRNKSSLLYYLLLAFLLLNVIVLYILHFVHDPFDNDVFKLDIGEGDTVEKFKAVSYDENGKLTVGGGISVFLNQAVLDDTVRKDNVLMEPLMYGEVASKNVLGYRKDKSTSVLTTFQVNEDASITVDEFDQGNEMEDVQIQGFVALSKTHGVALYVSTLINNVSPGSVPSILVPVKINNGKVELLKDNQISVSEYSITSFLQRMSDTEFSIMEYAYLETFTGDFSAPRVQLARMGSINEDYTLNDLTDGLQVGGMTDSNRSVTFGNAVPLKGLEQGFVVPWYAQESFSNYDEYSSQPVSGLCLDVVRYDVTNTTVPLQTGQTACTRKHQPVYFMESVAISDSNLAVVFYDRANNYALTVSTIEISPFSSSIRFRNSIVIEGAAGQLDFGSGFSWFPTPKITMVSSKYIVVSFLHAGKNGQPSIATIKLGNDLQPSSTLTASVPADGYTIDATESTDVLTMSLLPTKSNEVIFTFVGNEGSDKYIQRMNVIQLLSPPIGIATDDDKIATQGKINLDESLVAGRTYYTTTNGKLVSGPILTDTGSDFEMISDTLMVSKSSRLGRALDEDTIQI